MKTNAYFLRFIFLICCLTTISCKKEDNTDINIPAPPPPSVNPCGNNTSVVDIEGNSYFIVTIGNQCWLASNLRTSMYRNGQVISNVVQNNSWSNLTTGAWAYYENNSSFNTIHGKLYNFYAVSDTRGICPEGWHVATDNDWKELEQHLGMPQSELNQTNSLIRGSSANVGGKLKSTSYWQSPNTGATNSSQFSARGSGGRAVEGFFGAVGQEGYWWTGSSNSSTLGWMRLMTSSENGISRGTENKKYGYCVRCVKD